MTLGLAHHEIPHAFKTARIKHFPLTSRAGNSERLRSQPEPSSRSHFISVISEEVWRCR